MNHLITSKGDVRIEFTNHAVKRFKERYGNRIFSIIHDDRLVKRHMIYEMQQGRLLECWERVPFYANKIAAAHGPGSKVIEYERAFYVMEYRKEEKAVFVRSVLPNFLYYKANDHSIVVTGPGGARWIDKDKYDAYLARKAKREQKAKEIKIPPKKRLTRW